MPSEIKQDTSFQVYQVCQSQENACLENENWYEMHAHVQVSACQESFG